MMVQTSAVVDAAPRQMETPAESQEAFASVADIEFCVPHVLRSARASYCLCLS